MTTTAPAPATVTDHRARAFGLGADTVLVEYLGRWSHSLHDLAVAKVAALTGATVAEVDDAVAYPDTRRMDFSRLNGEAVRMASGGLVVTPQGGYTVALLPSVVLLSLDGTTEGGTPAPAPVETVEAEEAEVVGGAFVVTTDGESVVLASYAQAGLWNGYVCPWFTLAEAREVARVMPWAVRVDESRQVVEYDDEQGDGWQAVPTTTVENSEVYGIGAGWWTWSLATDGTRLAGMLPMVGMEAANPSRAAAVLSASVALIAGGLVESTEDDREIRESDPVNDEQALALMLANLHTWADARGVDWDDALLSHEATRAEDADRWAATETN